MKTRKDFALEAKLKIITGTVILTSASIPLIDRAEEIALLDTITIEYVEAIFRVLYQLI